MRTLPPSLRGASQEFLSAAHRFARLRSLSIVGLAMLCAALSNCRGDSGEKPEFAGGQGGARPHLGDDDEDDTRGAEDSGSGGSGTSSSNQGGDGTGEETSGDTQDEEPIRPVLALERVSLRADRAALGFEGSVAGSSAGISLEFSFLDSDETPLEPTLFLPVGDPGTFSVSGTLPLLLPESVTRLRARALDGEDGVSPWVSAAFDSPQLGDEGTACDEVAALVQCEPGLYCTGFASEERLCSEVERACPEQVATASLTTDSDSGMGGAPPESPRWSVSGDFSTDQETASPTSCGGSSPIMVPFVAPELGRYRASLRVDSSFVLASLGLRSHCSSSAPEHEQACKVAGLDQAAELDVFLDEGEEIFLSLDAVGRFEAKTRFSLLVEKL